MSGEETNQNPSFENQYMVLYDNKLVTLYYDKNEVVIEDNNGTELERFPRNVVSVVMITDYLSLRKAILLGLLPLIIIASITMMLALSYPRLFVPILILGSIAGLIECTTAEKFLKKVYALRIELHDRFVPVQFLSYVAAAEFVSKLEFEGKEAFLEKNFGPLRDML